MKEVYGLEFYKKWVQDRERPFITQKVYRSYNSVLSFIGRTDTESFIYDLNRSIFKRGDLQKIKLILISGKKQSQENL